MFSRIFGFASQKRGNIAMMSGLIISVVLIATGMSVDYSRALLAKNNLQRATDSAALSLLRNSSLSQRELNAQARRFVLEYLDDEFKVGSINVAAERLETGDISVKSGMSVQAAFMQIRGYPSLEVSTDSVAAQNEGFLDVYLVLDRSSSMAVALDGPDADDMMALTRPMVAGTSKFWSEPDGCAFACHSTQDWQADGVPLAEHAAANNIRLRYDVLVDAATGMASTLLSDPKRRVRVGVVHFADTSSLAAEPSENLADVTATLAQPITAAGNTHFHNLFEFLESEMGVQGDGKSDESPRKMVVLVTDGVYSQLYTDGTVRALPAIRFEQPDFVNYYEPFDASLCATMIEREIPMVVVNTVYSPLENSGTYDDFVFPYAHLVDDSMKGCATEGYFEVNTTEEINTLFGQLAQDLGASEVRITQ